MAEEAMESYLCATYPPYSYRYPPPKGKGGAARGWRPRGAYLAAYGDAAAAAEYFDNYQRAQLRAILSQVNPALTPRLRKANTREAAVQVNPRQDAAVQCSLGQRTLLLRRRPAPPEQEQGSPATTSTRAVRFPRTIAVYSPMASRRLTAFLEEPGAQAERRPRDGPAEQQPQQQQEAAAAAAVEEAAAQREAAAAVRASWEQPEAEGGAEPLGQRPPAAPDGARHEAAPAPAAPGGSAEPAADPKREAAPGGSAEPAAGPKREAAPEGSAEPAAGPKQEAAPGKGRLRFQFLEQKYGYYHCKDCNIRWESAYVWCVQGTNKVYFRQFCRTCQKSYNPYRVEDITCQSCKQTRCTCPVKMRHVDPKRPHRQDLCGRCKGKRLSCDSTFSFKYII
ncbi:zygote arrest protein 1 [Eudromia elegans]